MANKAITDIPIILDLFPKSIPFKLGKSLAINFERLANVESKVEPPANIINIAIKKKATIDIFLPTSAGTFPVNVIFSNEACIPIKLNINIVKKPKMPETINALNISFSSHINPLSVKTGS